MQEDEKDRELLPQHGSLSLCVCMHIIILVRTDTGAQFIEREY